MIDAGKHHLCGRPDAGEIDSDFSARVDALESMKAEPAYIDSASVRILSNDLQVKDEIIDFEPVPWLLVHATN
ncbi:MAG: hypothetical protein IH606_19580 [Burkholderiales bacterium]|nr:hypothetical protein [Burkholderiales bacterium]